MSRIVLLLMILCVPFAAAASHGWSEIDLCTVYKDRLPPGLTTELLPEAQSQGASLLDRYCTQCHNLPGPDRHSAAEWQDVAAKMFMLMDVSSRFGKSRSKVETMQAGDQTLLLAYLQRNAANSLVNEKPADREANSLSWLQRSLTLLPLLLLTGVGLLRWRWTLRRSHRPCIIEQ